jgi:hypothetical protein
LNLWVRGGKQHCETNASYRRNDHVANTTQLCLVGNVTNKNCYSSGNGVRWDGQKLRLGTLVAHAEKDSREKERETVQWAKATHVNDSISPGLPVAKGGENVSAVDASDLGAGLSIHL